MRQHLFATSGLNVSPKNLVIPLLLLFSCANEELPIHEPTNTNLVLVTIDTLRTDRIGVYGGPENLTPAIDALAARGVTFLDTSAHAPLTVPSHAALLTGQFPSKLGVRDNAGFPLASSAETLAEKLKEAGYRTGAFVSSYVLNRHTGLAQGFDTYSDRFATGTVHLTPASLERPGPEIAAEAEEWLESVEEPFFLWTHYYDPHSPYEAPRAFAESVARTIPTAPRLPPPIGLWVSSYKRFRNRCVRGRSSCSQRITVKAWASMVSRSTVSSSMTWRSKFLS